MKSKKSAAIKSHQGFGALRIGTLRDHESVAAAIALDAGWRCKVARNRKLPNSPSHVVAHKSQHLIAISVIHKQLR
jgi:hypothetical protein